MLIRALEFNDFNQIKLIHEKFYQKEFTIEDFYKAFLDTFVVLDDDKIIAAGGVRAIAESVIITNKDFSVRKRREALYTVLEISKFICSKHNFDQLHAFIHDQIWEEQLINSGFSKCKGSALFLSV